MSITMLNTPFLVRASRPWLNSGAVELSTRPVTETSSTVLELLGRDLHAHLRPACSSSPGSRRIIS